MPKDLTLITVRVDQHTLDRITRLTQNQRPLAVRRETKHNRGPYRRSEVIRHAINAGLDVLTDEPPLKL